MIDQMPRQRNDSVGTRMMWSAPLPTVEQSAYSAAQFVEASQSDAYTHSPAQWLKRGVYQAVIFKNGQPFGLAITGKTEKEVDNKVRDTIYRYQHNITPTLPAERQAAIDAANKKVDELQAKALAERQARQREEWKEFDALKAKILKPVSKVELKQYLFNYATNSDGHATCTIEAENEEQAEQVLWHVYGYDVWVIENVREMLSAQA